MKGGWHGGKQIYQVRWQMLGCGEGSSAGTRQLLGLRALQCWRGDAAGLVLSQRALQTRASTASVPGSSARRDEAARTAGWQAANQRQTGLQLSRGGCCFKWHLSFWLKVSETRGFSSLLTYDMKHPFLWRLLHSGLCIPQCTKL